MWVLPNTSLSPSLSLSLVHKHTHTLKQHTTLYSLPPSLSYTNTLKHTTYRTRSHGLHVHEPEGMGQDGTGVMSAFWFTPSDIAEFHRGEAPAVRA